MKNTRPNGISVAAIFILTLFLLCTDALAQSPEWKDYSNIEPSVKAIAEDGNYIWVGTENSGIIKIDKITHEETRYTTSNSGLISNRIRSLVVDSSGVKWIGTRDRGLITFDGDTWEVYNVDNSGLPVNNVTAIAIDYQNRKWIGTESGGLAVLDGSNWVVYNNGNSILPSEHINSIAFENDEAVWIGIWHFGLVKYDETGWVVFDTSNSELPSVNVNTIAVDENGTKWVGAWDRGLASFDGNNWNVYTTENSGIPSNSVGRILIDEDGNKWLNTQGGLVVLNGNEWTIYDTNNSGIPGNILGAIAIADDGTKWIGIRPSGLVSFDGTDWIIHCTSDIAFPPWPNLIEVANNGNIWVSYWSSLVEFDGYNMMTYDESLWGGSNSGINCLKFEPSGELWVGTNNDGLVSFDGTEWTIYDTSNSELPHNHITSIAIDENGKKWLGTRDDASGDYPPFETSLCSYNGAEWTVFDSTNSGFPGGLVSSIAIDNNGTIWVGIYALFPTQGLYSFDGTTWTSYDSTNSEWPYGGVRSIALDNNDNIWVLHELQHGMSSTEYSLVRTDRQNWTIFDASNSGYPEYYILALAIEDSGNVWLGVEDLEGVGVVSFDGSEWVNYSTTNSDLPSPIVSSIAIDNQNNKWVAHSLGVSVFNEGGVTVGLDHPEQVRTLPSSFWLDQNYPNPFNPNTTISYDIPEKADVELLIYDLRGRLVTRLVEGHQPGGSHQVQWNAMDQQGQPVSTGVYFCQLKASGFNQTIKMIYLK